MLKDITFKKERIKFSGQKFDRNKSMKKVE